MKRDTGSPDSPIWLLADSPPRKHQDWLEGPLDMRHPTRHNIWTPIETVINRELFVHHRRIDGSQFFIRNAVEHSKYWNSETAVDEELSEFRIRVGDKRPRLFLTFGQNAFEFARRFLGEERQKFNHWKVPKIKIAFDDRFPAVLYGEQNLLPLLHACIARRAYKEIHVQFSQNYFEYVGCKIADILKQCNDGQLSNLWKEKLPGA